MPTAFSVAQSPHVQEYVPGTSLPRALLEAFLIILLFPVFPLVFKKFGSGEP